MCKLFKVYLRVNQEQIKYTTGIKHKVHISFFWVEVFFFAVELHLNLHGRVAVALTIIIPLP